MKDKSAQTNMEESIKIILHKDDIQLNRPLDSFKASMSRQVSAECRRLEAAHKKKTAAVQVAGMYSVFIALLGIFIWNYLLKGPSGVLTCLLPAVVLLSILLLCCIPLLLKFKTNISERREYR